MNKIQIINGPNLNKLGEREVQVYGKKNLKEIQKECIELSNSLDISLDFFQSNSESEIIESIQQSSKYSGLILNAGAFTHTSVAIHDSLKILNIPIVEVHISNPFKREPFRQISYISSVATGIVSGFGTDVYKIAIQALALKIGN
ncbi:MAG: type II 3-dehydroquinate dehydratase [Rickettsiales bacterium]|nr:type II 3-dehydroquinate dehydratase [Rickettsiales bacterium]OUW72525.1 MAG: type II 3-dehydroquinate dehydratase [Rickettsiales bacterium TMED211]